MSTDCATLPRAVAWPLVTVSTAQAAPRPLMWGAMSLYDWDQMNAVLYWAARKNMWHHIHAILGALPHPDIMPAQHVLGGFSRVFLSRLAAGTTLMCRSGDEPRLKTDEDRLCVEYLRFAMFQNYHCRRSLTARHLLPLRLFSLTC